MNRILSLVLLLVMIAATVWQTGLTVCSDGQTPYIPEGTDRAVYAENGSTADPAALEIETVEDLEKLRAEPGAHALLKNDLTISGSDWEPIGSTETPFSGVFDGCGHTVTFALDQKKTGKNALVGLFGCVTGSVKRLEVKGTIKVSVRSACVGAVAAVLTGGGTVFSCRSETEIKADCKNASAVGGLVGAVCFSGANPDGTILCCRTSGSIAATVTSDAAQDGSPLAVGSTGAIGGLLGFSEDNARVQVRRCVNEGPVTVTGGKYNVGGIVGQTSVNSSVSRADLLECANKGDITVYKLAGERAAGIIGYIKSGSIENCYNTGNVRAWSDDGTTPSRAGYGTNFGIFGYANLAAGNTLSVLNCYNASPEPLEAEICVVRNPSYGVFRNYFMNGREEYETELKSGASAGTRGKAFTDASSLAAMIAEDESSPYRRAFDENGNELYPVLAFETETVLPAPETAAFYGTVREKRESFDLRVILNASEELSGAVLTVSIRKENGDREEHNYTLGKDLKTKKRVYADNVAYRAPEGFRLYSAVFADLPYDGFKTVDLSVAKDGKTVAEAGAKYGTFLKEKGASVLAIEGLPPYPDGSASPVYNAGPGFANDKNGALPGDCREVVITGTSLASFNSYLDALSANGFKKRFGNTVDRNEYREYSKDGTLYYLYFTGASGEVRIVRDTASTAPVTDLKDAGGDAVPALWQYALDYTKGTGQTYGDDYYAIDCGMCYVIRLADNTLFLIDSGHERQSSDAALEALNGFLHEITGTAADQKVVISGWFFTHAHGDHVYMAHAFIEKYHDLYDVKAVFANFPSYPTLSSGYDGGTFLLKDTFNTFYPDKDVYKLHAGQTFSLPGVGFEILYTHEDAVNGATGKSTISNFNDTSTVLRVTIAGSSVLFLGDASGVCEATLMKNYKKDFLHSDAVQAAHHGFNNLSQLYRLIAAPIILWPNSLENADKNSTIRKGAINAAGGAYIGIYYAGEYTYKLSFGENGISIDIDRKIYTDGLFFDIPNALGVFEGSAEAETPASPDALSALEDLTPLVNAKSCRGTPGAKADEAPQTVFDGNTFTKWCETTSASAYLAFRTKEPVAVCAYTLFAGSDTASHKERNPKCWTLWASEDGQNWVALDRVYDGAMNVTGGSASSYLTDARDGRYSFFVLYIHSFAGEGTTVQLSELKLYGEH